MNGILKNKQLATVKGMIVFLVILFAQASFAQDKHVHKDLPKNHTIKETISLNENGIIFKTGYPITAGKYASTLMYYDAQSELIWEKKIPGEYSQGEEILVVSPTGEIVYSIDLGGFFGKEFSGKTHYLTQIRKNGQEKKFELPGKEEYGKSLQTVFCDDQYLYYLATQNGDEEKENKKAEDKLILSRFSHADLSYKRFTLDLPLIAEGENTTFWSFIGQKDGENYLVSKAMDTGLGKNIFEVVSFNAEGQVSKKKSIALTLDKKFTRPAWSVDVPRQPFENFTDLDFNVKTSVSTAPNMGSSRSSGYADTAGAFGYLMLDAANNCFYSYGLFGPKPFQNMAPVNEGFYIIKYDLEGNEKWRLQQMASPKLMDEKFFRVQGRSSDRDICLKVLPGGRLNFSIHFVRSLYDFDISAEGKLLGEQSTSDVLEPTGNIFSATEKLKSAAFIKKEEVSGKSKTVGYSTALTSSGEILIRIDGKESGFDLYYFKK